MTKNTQDEQNEQQLTPEQVNPYMGKSIDELTKLQNDVLADMRQKEEEPVEFEFTPESVNVLIKGIKNTPWNINSLRPRLELIARLEAGVANYEQSKKIALPVVFCMMLVNTINQLSGMVINEDAMALDEALASIADKLLAVHEQVVLPKMNVINGVKEELSLINNAIEMTNAKLAGEAAAKAADK